MNKKTLDYNFGHQKELSIIEKLKNKFGNNIRSKDRYCLYDFESDECIFELKSRRCLKGTYNTTMIGMDKIRNLESMNKKIILLFSFIDKDCFFEYDSNDDIIVDVGGRNDRGYNEFNDYLYIPINLLKEF